jgi:hypothetical protein
VLHRGQQGEFLDEALQAVGFHRAVQPHDLQHLRRPALGVLGQEDRGHAALADLAQHAVAFDEEMAAAAAAAGVAGAAVLERLRAVWLATSDSRSISNTRGGVLDPCAAPGR